MRKKRLGIFGGTFDPPHLGHVILAAEAADQLQLDQVLWLLSPAPPHKRKLHLTPYDERAAFVQACIQSEPKFALSLLENERPGPHYTSDTLTILRERYPQCEIILLIGGDSLNDMPEWHEPALILERVDQLGVMERPGDGLDWERLSGFFPDIREKVALIDAPLLEISSSEIRERVAAGHHYRYYLTDPVYRLVDEKGYYK